MSSSNEHPRVGIIFDKSVRPDTTGGHCEAALRSLCTVTWLDPRELESVNPDEFDLFVRIDDGLPYVHPETLRPLVWWAIDTHLDLARCAEVARAADVTFVAQRSDVSAMQEAGARSVSWLPLASQPECHDRSDAETEVRFDVSFVGHVVSPERARLLAEVADTFPRHFIGRAEPARLGEIYSASSVVINRSVAGDLNMRVFEALGSGTVLVTDELPPESGLTDLFIVGEHLLTYRSEEEAVELIRALVDDKGRAQRIGQQGRAEILARHTYSHRMQTLLDQTRSLWKPPLMSKDSTLKAPRSRTKSSRAIKSTGYFDHPRPEVAALVPEDATDILDVGCGAGALGALLKSHRSIRVTGIERDADAIAIARTRLDDVLMRDLEIGASPLPESAFDVVICADVLEHLRQPEHVLVELRRALRPGGTLITSLPNVQHHSILTGLIEGDFCYEPSGLLDDDHARFFTKREIEKLLFRAGYQVESLEPLPTPGTSLPEPHEDQLAIDGLLMTGLTPERLREFHAYQYLTVASPREDRPDSVTSIVILTHNGLHDTIACLESIRFRTVAPYELIVVDNGSTDGTVEYLRRQPDVTLIENAENLGFPKGCNQGLEVATGDFLLLLNNDTVVTTGWLTRMHAALRSDDSLGVVGPCSNRISGWQQVEADYRSTAELERFAWGWSKTHAGVVERVDRIVGFCMLFPRSVLDEIGTLDERFGIGNFEDDDYCRRVTQAGRTLGIARDAFVHHKAQQTFARIETDYQQLLNENRRLFEQKWSRRSELSAEAEPNPRTPPAPVRLAPLDGDALRLQSNVGTVSLCMIVRNNETTLGAALESVRDHVDEMIVVDTGSTDRTVEIAQTAGAIVRHFDWCDDFAAARNESLRHATAEWIFWMDSDDLLPSESGHRLRELVQRNHVDEVLGYVFQVECPGESGTPDRTVVDHVKLFRNDPRLEFEGRIHEQIIGSIRRAGGEVHRADVRVVHANADRSPDGRAGKVERDLRILHKDLIDRPDHPFVLFNLGMTHADAGQHRTAVWYFRRCLAVSVVGESHVAKAYALYVASLTSLERLSEAERVCLEALSVFPNDPELLFRSALLHQEAGRNNEAISTWRTLLSVSDEQEFRSRDAGLGGYKARHNLALLLSEVDQLGEAELEWRRVVEEEPGFLPGWRALAELLLRQRRFEDARRLRDAMPAAAHIVAEGLLIEAKALFECGTESKAFEVLSNGWDTHREFVLGDELAKRFFEAGRFIDAEMVLEAMSDEFPEHERVVRNLSTVRQMLHAEQPDFVPVAS